MNITRSTVIIINNTVDISVTLGSSVVAHRHTHLINTRRIRDARILREIRILSSNLLLHRPRNTSKRIHQRGR